MTALRLVIIILALAAINLVIGLAGLFWGVDRIKMSPFTLFATTILYLAAAVTGWIKWRERKERQAKQEPPDENPGQILNSECEPSRSSSRDSAPGFR